MLRLSLSQEELDKALEEDFLLRNMERNRWFSLPVHKIVQADGHQTAVQGKPRRIDWNQWPQCGSKDS